jgi:hypothetical protein
MDTQGRKVQLFAYSLGIFRSLCFTLEYFPALIQRLQKLHTYQIEPVPGAVAAHTRLDRRRFGRQRRGRRRRSRDCQIYDLIVSYGPSRRKVRTRGANIERLCEVEEFQSGGVRTSDEHWNLYVNPLRTPALSGG